MNLEESFRFTRLIRNGTWQSIVLVMLGYTIGIDTGGTFTDTVCVDESGMCRTAKSPTTPNDFSIGVIDSLTVLAKGMQMSLEEMLGKTNLIKHGCTVATNALLTRGGVKVGLITTRGFEDTSLIMRAIGRVDGLPEEEVKQVPHVTKPEPLVPKTLILGVRERIDYKGKIIVPLQISDVEQATNELLQEGVDAIAVSTLQSWSNPVHEELVEKKIKDMTGDRVYVSLGSRLTRVSGEYARTNTAIINAYVAPVMNRYLDNVVLKLRKLKFKGNLLVMQGNGGASAIDKMVPIQNLQSGPAGGVAGSAFMSSTLGHKYVIATDMGGTSFDVSLIVDNSWTFAEEPIFSRFRILQPLIDVESIGAGGGTIAKVDEVTGRLLVGPQSAQADPGPACYGRGKYATVTDANLILGYLDPENYLGGRLKLYKEKSIEAIQRNVAGPMNMDVTQSAAAIHAIINAKMADLIRQKVVKSGYLPEDFVLYSFGGAGPIHASGFAGDLGIDQIYVFLTSSVFSAMGAALAEIIHSWIATVSQTFPIDFDYLNNQIAASEEELRSRVVRQGVDGDIVTRRFLGMRYRRQIYGVEVDLPWSTINSENISDMLSRFEEKYRTIYGEGTGSRESGIEIYQFRIDVFEKRQKPKIKFGFGSNRSSLSEARKSERQAYFTSEKKFLTTPVYDLDKLPLNEAVKGPAIVESTQFTTLVPPRMQGTMRPEGCLILHNKEA